jgi:hypothetical protein
VTTAIDPQQSSLGVRTGIDPFADLYVYKFLYVLTSWNHFIKDNGGQDAHLTITVDIVKGGRHGLLCWCKCSARLLEGAAQLRVAVVLPSLHCNMRLLVAAQRIVDGHQRATHCVTSLVPLQACCAVSDHCLKQRPGHSLLPRQRAALNSIGKVCADIELRSSIVMAWPGCKYDHPSFLWGSQSRKMWPGAEVALARTGHALHSMCVCTHTRCCACCHVTPDPVFSCPISTSVSLCYMAIVGVHRNLVLPKQRLRGNDRGCGCSGTPQLERGRPGPNPCAAGRPEPWQPRA